MLSILESQAEENDVVLLHACAHNPTGIDPSSEQWGEIADLCKRKRLVPFFDAAYQGFASGEFDDDAWAVRYFQRNLFDNINTAPAGMCIAQSFAKNFGLYGERVGAFHLLLPEHIQSKGAFSQLVSLTRAEISNPPLFGARIVSTILSNEELKAQWVRDLKTMAGRVKDVRSQLREQIEKHPGSRNWSHLTSQIGMFSYTGLTEEQVQRMRDIHHIYMMRNGRVSMSGVNQSNVEYIASAFAEVTATRASQQSTDHIINGSVEANL
jgi:aspartate/tyrosine/aromatic aminotransferase